MNQAQDVPSIIQQVARFAVAGDSSAARNLLAGLELDSIAEERKRLQSAIWSPGITRPARASITPAKRVSVTERIKLQAFRRDKFTCRYAHCQRRTIYIPVLKELSRLFPDAMPYHSNWKPLSDHLLYWVYGTSIEHKLSFPYGGDSAETNLITACYCCNDAKNYLHLDDLAWEITEPADSDWDGVEGLLPALKRVAHHIAAG